jgi:hypothetical protein
MRFNIVGPVPEIQAGRQITIEIDKFILDRNEADDPVAISAHVVAKDDLETLLRKAVQENGGIDLAKGMIAGNLVVADAVKAQTEVLQSIHNRLSVIADHAG